MDFACLSWTRHLAQTNSLNHQNKEIFKLSRFYGLNSDTMYLPLWRHGDVLNTIIKIAFSTYQIFSWNEFSSQSLTAKFFAISEFHGEKVPPQYPSNEKKNKMHIGLTISHLSSIFKSTWSFQREAKKNKKNRRWCLPSASEIALW